MTTNSEDIKEQAGNEAKVTNRFIRIIQRKALPWEKDSIARAANDPDHIPDYNVQASVGQHFLFHDSQNGKWTRVPSSNHKVDVVAARTVSKSMDS